MNKILRPRISIDPSLVLEMPMEGFISGAKVQDRSQYHNAGTIFGGLFKYPGMYFNGVNSYIDFGDIGSDIKTIEFWINPNTTTQSIFEEIDNIGVAIVDGTIIYPNWGNCFVDCIDTDIISVGWHHVVLTSTTNIIMSAFRLGLVDTTFLDGLIDEVRIYNRELSALERKNHYELMRWKFSGEYIHTLDLGSLLLESGDGILLETGASLLIE